MNARPALPEWLRTAVFYQIYPQSFLDTNGDGIGDLPGIVSKLDYLHSLGCNALWLNPVFESPFKDAGYDVSNFYKVAPRYGSNADLKRLFAEAHRRDMRVVLDLVAGHTSDQHPWFKASARAGRNRHSDHYIWTDSVWSTFSEPRLLPGHERNGCYLPNFFPCQPALNYGYARIEAGKDWQQPMNAPGPRAVLSELRRIMAFWLDAGCDGFRVDMAASLVKNDPDGKGIRALWKGIRRWLDRDHPEAVLVSEWGNPSMAIAAGFHLDFLLHFGEPAYQHLCAPQVEPKAGAGRGFFDSRGRGDIRVFLDNYLRHWKATQGRGYIALPSGNHDFARFRHRRSEAELRVFLAMLLTMPGVPFIYYGDEIGLEFREGLVSKEGGYSRTGTRTPMQWTAGKNRGFSTAPAAKLYLPTNEQRGQDVAAQEGDPNSLLHTVRALLELRRDFPALGNDGEFEPLHAKPKPYPFVFLRRSDHERIVVAINPCQRGQRLNLPLLKGALPLAARRASVVGQQLRMAGFSFGIFAVSPKQN
ncbi:MAG: alpha-amylase family glycosyl hydrolase [Verrucomicrobia bacterium]|nr:alpha-amylase family glycosyl hydrolase [Verrucomicrobiota bacterium]